MIEEHFTIYGCHLNLIKREGRVHLYKCTNRESGEDRGYEVMVSTYKEEARIGDRVIPAGHFLPSTSQWGIMGWTYLSSELVRAEAKFATCCKKYPTVAQALLEIDDVKKPKKKPRKIRRVIRRIKR